MHKTHQIIRWLFGERRDNEVLHRKLDFIILNQIRMGKELDDLEAAVTADTEVDTAAVTLLTGLKEKLDAAIASGDPAKLTALSTQLGQNKDALAAAIVANTPAA